VTRISSNSETTGLEALARFARGSAPREDALIPKNIMVVDDNPANLQLLEDMLRQYGYDVRSFPLGRLALAAAAEEPPDLILLDINMPEMDGFEVCRRLRADVALSSVPVIFLSALDETKDKLAAFRCGGFDYVTKPFEQEEVQARIATQLELRELRARVERQNHDLESLVRQQVREIADGQMATIFALAKLADSRDNETGKHLERVQMLCRLLAIEMKASPNYSGTITDRYVENIYCASPLHDIGKVAIPDAILLKAGTLTDEEFTVMKTHTTHGARTLELVLEKHPANAFVRMGIEIARSHHEMWDGAGYPDGLAGLEIPVSARIMAVADCYDALRSRRRYKEPFSHEESRDIIVRDSGHHFEPEMVSAFCKVQESFRQVSERMA
jgi:putative two-component system response regulator